MGVPLLELGGGYIRRAALELGLNDKLALHQTSDPERAATAEFRGPEEELDALCKKACSLFRSNRKGSPWPWILGEA